MVFSDYMNGLPNVKVDTINEIAKLTCSTTLAVYRWINGSCEPPMLKKRIISEYLNKDVEELWPKKVEESV